MISPRVPVAGKAAVHAGIPLASMIAALFATGCIFDTRPSYTFAPDLSPGSEWMYGYRQYALNADGTRGDTSVHFDHYRVGGDTVVAGVTYTLLSEEELAIYNSDYGLVTSRALFAFRWDGSALEVDQLKGGGSVSGALPFKVAAFDTAHFDDQIRVLQSPLYSGQAWTFRQEGQPYGHAAATKTLLGPENIVIDGQNVSTLKFRLDVSGLSFLSTYEWYKDGVKLLTRSASAGATAKDSLIYEQRFLGRRGFAHEDTQTVVDAYKRQLQ